MAKKRERDCVARTGEGSYGPQAGLWAATLTCRPVFHLACLLLLCCLAYANTFLVPFVIDDELSILQNPVVKDLKTFLFDGAGFRYNPRRVVGYFTFALNYRMGGEHVFGYHLVNLAVHLVNTWLVYLLVRLALCTPRMAGTRPAEGDADPLQSRAFSLVPLFAALLFALHPLQTQAVTYVVQRLASLATCFYLATVVCYLLGRLRRGGLYYVAAAAAAAASFLTKEISATLPVALLICEFSFFGVSRKKLIWALLFSGASAAGITGLLLLKGGVGGAAALLDALTRETDTISRGDYLLTQFSVLVTYLRLVIFPAGQNLDYDYPVYHSLFHPKVFSSLLVLALLLVLACYLYRRKDSTGAPVPWCRLAGFGIAWFFAAISVESGIIPIRDVIFEHRMYLPSVGLFSAMASVLVPLMARFRYRGALFGVGATAVVLTLLTLQRNHVWGSSVRLWQDCVDKSPGKLRPRNNLANALLAEGRTAEAVVQLEAALRIAPGDFAALRNLGVAYEKTGGLDKSIELYQRALKANPGNKFTRYNLGRAYHGKGLAALAIVEFEEAIKLDPGYADAHNNLGVLYAATARINEAVEQFRLAARLDPDSAEAHLNLGRALTEQGEGAAALGELQRAAKLQPDNAEIFNAMGIVCAKAGRTEEAAALFRKAAQLRPGEPRYLDNLYRLRGSG